MNIIEEVFEVIKDRKVNPREDSYVSRLNAKGEEEILRKIGEETVELILASKKNSKDEIIYEAADLLFHLMVLLGYKDIELEELYQELRRRRK
jgi:phosphoribosyl-ATP pyrophosphohydrolase